MGQTWGAIAKSWLTRPGGFSTLPGAAERVGIDEEQRFDAGIDPGDAGIGDVDEGDAEARLAGEAVGELDAGLELDRIAEVEAPSVVPIAGCRVTHQHDVVAERQLDEDAGIAEEGAVGGGEGADQRPEDPQEGLAEAVFNPELGLGARARV